jgi:hypothetical protein
MDIVVPLYEFDLEPSANPNLCIIIDDRVVSLLRSWPFSRAADYRHKIDTVCPNWKSFTILQGSINNDVFVGQPLCGSVKP